MTWGYNKDHESVDRKIQESRRLSDSVNDAIDTLVKANPENRIAIAVFNGSSTALLPELTTGSKILERYRTVIIWKLQAIILSRVKMAERLR